MILNTDLFSPLHARMGNNYNQSSKGYFVVLL